MNPIAEFVEDSQMFAAQVRAVIEPDIVELVGEADSRSTTSRSTEDPIDDGHELAPLDRRQLQSTRDTIERNHR